MTSATLLRVCMVLLLVDLGCLALGKPQSWLYSLGMCGVMIDFLLLLVGCGLYPFLESGG
jgi:hypothetical protein